VVRGQKTFEEVHELSDHIEREIQERLPGAVVVIHLEPETARTRTTLEELAKGQTAAGRMEEPDATGIAERHRHEEG
jgi:hypothetical protein